MVIEYKLKFDKKFTKQYRKLDRNIQIEGDKKIKDLKLNPIKGKKLEYFNSLYELKIRMYRIFYAIDDHKISVLFIGVEHKDECDKYLRGLTNEKIKSLIEENF